LAPELSGQEVLPEFYVVHFLALVLEVVLVFYQFFCAASLRVEELGVNLFHYRSTRCHLLFVQVKALVFFPQLLVLDLFLKVQQVSLGLQLVDRFLSLYIVQFGDLMCSVLIYPA